MRWAAPEHEALCPSQQWTKWWQVRFAAQDCRCELIRRVRAVAAREEQERIADGLDALPWHHNEHEEPLVRVSDVRDLIGGDRWMT